MIEQLRMIAIRLMQEKKDSPEEVKKYQLIEEMLKNNQCFFELDIETSYAILRDLGFEEDDLEKVYSLLIDSSNYQNDNIPDFMDN